MAAEKGFRKKSAGPLQKHVLRCFAVPAAKTRDAVVYHTVVAAAPVDLNAGPERAGPPALVLTVERVTARRRQYKRRALLNRHYKYTAAAASAAVTPVEEINK